MNRRWIVVAALLLALVAAVVALPGIQLAGAPVERLTNGSFEEGFYSTPVGFVGNGWHWFHNGGRIEYGFYNETWTPVIYEGKHGQMIELDTIGQAGSEADRYAGIYQTVAVVPGEAYELSVHGMLRALEDDPDREGYNYRVQVGVDYGGGTDWTQVENWIELPWDTVYPRLSPGEMDSYTASLTATGERMTLFIRVWKKWSTVGRELDVNLDAISLKGAMPADTDKPSVSLTSPDFPVVGWNYTIPVAGSNGVGITRLELYDGSTLLGSVVHDVGLLSLSHNFAWKPEVAGPHTLKAVAYDAGGAKGTAQATVKVGEEGQFLTNGDFEGGFAPIPLGKVGKGWSWFYNDAQAGYGFYDETWPPAVQEGQHSQMIEVNTLGRSRSDPDRYAGIYQTVNGLTVGATYRLSLYGLLRVLANDDDQVGYNYRVQWGYDPAGGTDWQAVDNWVEIPWNRVDTRLDPGMFSAYTAGFKAPATKVTLFIRVWKKWATTDRELDVNLDNISLTGYK